MNIDRFQYIVLNDMMKTGPKQKSQNGNYASQNKTPRK